MESNEELGMGLFQNLDDSVELNLDDAPEEIKALLSDEGEEGTEPGTPNPDNITPQDGGENLNEGSEGSPEGVVEGGEEEGDNQQDDSPNLYSSFATVLSEQGLFPSLNLEETEIKDVDSLVDAFKSEINNQTKDYLINKIGEKGYEALEKGVTLSEYEQYNSNVQTLDNIDAEVLSEDLELSKNVILQDYISQGLSEERAYKLLKKTIDLGEDVIIEDAKESLESLKVAQAKQLEELQEQRQKEAALQVAEQEKIDNDLKSAIYQSNEIIEGIKIDKNTQDKIYQNITKIVSQAPNGVMENQLMQDRRKNPVDFDIKMYYLYDLTNGFTDFSKLVRKSESKAVSKLEQTLRQTNFKAQGGTPTYLDDAESYDGGFGSELVI
jgi:hypothetical protein